uniref:DUF6788 domain-containing protein n=1 Tax=Thermus caliditerrae TaxID=1330700 RepID=A0A7C5VFL5_9DEIN
MTAERTQDLIARIYRDLDELEAEIARLDREIQGKVPLHVKAKWKRCGKPRCACQRGRKHGPYLYAYIPDEEVRAKRREKGGRGSTRKEVYLGKDFTPPEGWARPQEVRKLLQARRRLVERREKLLKALSRIEEEVLGASRWTAGPGRKG